MRTQKQESFSFRSGIRSTLIPWLRTFTDTFEHFVPKFWTGIVIFVAWMENLIQVQEFSIQGLTISSVPMDYWIALNLCIICNFVAGTWRSLTNKHIKFTPAKWVRTGRKLVSLNGGAFIIGVLFQAFPEPYNYIQLVYYFLFTGREGWSALEHFGLAPSLEAAIEAFKTGGWASIAEIVREKKRKQHEEYESKQLNEEPLDE